MSKVKRILRNRLLITILAVTMGWGSLTVAVSQPAHGCPPCQIWYTYYTDASLTTTCGWKVINDTGCGHATSSGCQTAFYEIEQVCW